VGLLGLSLSRNISAVSAVRQSLLHRITRTLLLATERSITNDKHRKRYSTAPQVCERYGGRSAMWLWRKLKFDPNFPRPFVIASRRYFDEDELDQFDNASRMEAPNAAS
jgi:hypothetical protein